MEVVLAARDISTRPDRNGVPAPFAKVRDRVRSKGRRMVSGWGSLAAKRASCLCYVPVCLLGTRGLAARTFANRAYGRERGGAVPLVLAVDSVSETMER